jgi:cytochrome c oxidase assembly protein subunit 15
MTPASQTGPRHPLLGAALTCGFAVAIGLWIAWFVTHLPWLGLPEQFSMPGLLGVWIAGAIATGVAAGRKRGPAVGAMSGLVTALVGLLLLGSKLAEAPAMGDAASGLKPAAAQIALAFLVLGVVIGAVGGLAGGLAAGRSEDPQDVDWLARFAIVAVFAAAPLLFVGGLVTSTNSGMAVPDWPNTYGSNMFLYPLGPRIRPDVFLEHSHRLFGTLVGLTLIVLTVWTLIVERRRGRRWVKTLVLAALATVVVQGMIGGLRVLTGSTEVAQDPRLLRFVHGVLAQITFALLMFVAIALSPLWRRATADRSTEDLPGLLRRLRFFSTGFLHASMLQLIFGAMYRHFRDSHSLWTHAAFSAIVVIMAAGAGFAASGTRGNYGGIGPVIRRWGIAALVVVVVQFALGWVSLLVSGMGPDTRMATSPVEALVRTAHQANGALLLAIATALFFWTRRLLRIQAAAA